MNVDHHLAVITKKLNCHHSAIDVYLKNYKKIGNYPQKEIAQLAGAVEYTDCTSVEG